MSLNEPPITVPAPQTPPLSMRRACMWALVFIVPAYLLMLFGHDLWRPAETREAGIARVTIESGNWTATDLNDDLFLYGPISIKRLFLSCKTVIKTYPLQSD